MALPLRSNRAKDKNTTGSTVIKAADYQEDLIDFLAMYEYQPSLTIKLGKASLNDFDQGLVNEIVLWKVNRYVSIDQDLLRLLNDSVCRNLKYGDYEKGEQILRALLSIEGIDLALASCILRFANPKVFQIIDRHAYRAVYGVKLSLINKSVSNSISRKIKMYFAYLKKLMSLCEIRQLEFETIDRLLYVFDKKKNGVLK